MERGELDSHELGRDTRMSLSREWDELIAKVRRMNNLSNFMALPRLESLTTAGERGPVVTLTCAPSRCDAIIVLDGEVKSLRLPTDRETVFAKTEFYLQTIARFESATSALRREGTSIAQSDNLTSAQRNRAAIVKRDYELAYVDFEQRLLTILEWLWSHVTDPILTSLRITKPPSEDRWPRLWWCPTGAFSLLPIHAAGIHESGNDSVYDRAVQSYTPTVRALIESRIPSPDTHALSPKLLIVDVSENRDSTDLPGARREVQYIADLMKADSLTRISGEDANRVRVITELGSHRWVHFSCHGEQDLTDPSNSRLRLRNSSISVMDLALSPQQGDFAFLAACETGTGGTSLPDESITLAASLHYSGFRNVVASMWKIRDDASETLVKMFYERTCRNSYLDTAVVPYALHNAVRSLKELSPSAPSSWMPFTHIGP